MKMYYAIIVLCVLVAFAMIFGGIYNVLWLIWIGLVLTVIIWIFCMRAVVKEARKAHREHKEFLQDVFKQRLKIVKNSYERWQQVKADLPKDSKILVEVNEIIKLRKDEIQLLNDNIKDFK